MKVNPYLNFPGTAEQAFNLYKSIFGGEFAIVMRLKDAPGAEKISEDDKNLIMHIALPLGEGNMLMASDAPESMGFTVTGGNNCYVMISPDSREETKRIFDALADGGNIEQDLQDMFWGDYYGSLQDKFGIKWMLNFSNQGAA